MTTATCRSNGLFSRTKPSSEAGDRVGWFLYEEYHPYGTTAFRASAGASGFAPKRYRYTGKERDEETGLYYYGARYYPPWLGRWTAVDPEFSVNLYDYCACNPITFNDPDGRAPEPATVGKKQRLKAGFSTDPDVQPAAIEAKEKEEKEEAAKQKAQEETKAKAAEEEARTKYEQAKDEEVFATHGPHGAAGVAKGDTYKDILTVKFFKALVETADELGIAPMDLFSVLYSESNLDPRSDNKKGFVGFAQVHVGYLESEDVVPKADRFDKTGKALSGKETFLSASPEKQLEYVKKFWKQYVKDSGKPGYKFDSIEALYAVNIGALGLLKIAKIQEDAAAAGKPAYIPPSLVVLTDPAQIAANGGNSKIGQFAAGARTRVRSEQSEVFEAAGRVIQRIREGKL